MGMLALNRLLPVRQDRRRRKTQSRSMSIASLSGKKSSIGHPQGGKTRRCPGPDLPQGIWDDILALLPLQDAVRAGCVSHTLLSSWRCRPDLTFSNETLGLDGNVYGSNKLARVLAKRVDRIMKKHSGIGVKKFELHYGGSSLKSSYLDRWLRIAVAPGIEEVILLVPGQPNETYHNFPCSLLSNGSGSSIQHLRLTSCAFHPVAGFGCLRRLHLDEVDREQFFLPRPTWYPISEASIRAPVFMWMCASMRISAAGTRRSNLNPLPRGLLNFKFGWAW
ncbi:uncharacterized protein [Triticum aestivum]|uniref:uncharacterized protein n=1 Tax=Triticum aestivum TaxID=4565 RepID=UPI001D02EE19|nr:uncharacterized protein LOC123096756 [Triticum aestivum]